MRFLAVLSSLILAGLAKAYVGPGVVTGDTAVHDPTICKDGSGKYWLFSTGTGIEIRTSTDRTAWTYVGVVWPNGAPSATNTYTGTTNGALWAPDCQYVNSKFRLFYAASTFGSQNSAIFYAESTTGAPGSWTDEGLVISTSSSSNYNAIDPNLFISTGGSWYLSLGSFWTGIKLVQIDSTGALESSTITSIAERTANGGAIEASVIYQYGSYFYLFTSWDKCCDGTSSTYNIRVGRSTSVSGTYTDASGVSLLSGGGTLVLETHDSIYGPGGQDVFTDTDGPIMVYHYYTSTGSWLGINKLDFSSGWPVVV
ncbi:glycoside hydrolase family 43 protein [Punctularia strigosozonata HHB-11173 SS5]|uniref:glycoside hydrolase family 43 protein n=1 Tax=Punctularia strigosozonata (strain HHB-11173) TaxID=741275 RepID=UPI000441648D|nr:glycoside hydrolase family 43 protein [Punctularia strigosozonata HHB-11173 SS5]EIN11524.1 glycoside hydrolase family 43 protein [Punctularia strigosozonata HHB-11173 SS5]